jgi:hypothetical protein
MLRKFVAALAARLNPLVRTYIRDIVHDLRYIEADRLALRALSEMGARHV